MESNYEFMQNFIKQCERKVLRDVFESAYNIRFPTEMQYNEMKIAPTKEDHKIKALFYNEEHIGFLKYEVEYGELSHKLNISFIPKP